jgi:hypothetical protein
MSYTESNLSSTGFDYVVAVTQDSINGALMETLYAGNPEVILCYVYDESDPPVPVPIDHAALITAANGTDPFTVPAGTPGHDRGVQNLANAGFAFAVKVQVGLPPGVPLPPPPGAPPSTGPVVPPVVTLKPRQSSVTYTVTFKEFAVAEIVYGPRNSVSWFSQAQPHGTAWTFSGTVDLDFQDASFKDLKPNVQKRLTDIGDPNMFGVKQLRYDLNSSALIQGFEFDNLPPDSALGGFMTDNFVNTYFKGLYGGEFLGYAAAQVSGAAPSSIVVTDVNFFTPDAVGATGAPLTLNYLCAAGGDPLPVPVEFGWNWVEPVEVLQFDGVAALNRNTLAKYLSNVTFPDGSSLYSYVASNCYQTSVSVPLNGLIPSFSFSAYSGVQPAVIIPPAGGTLIAYSHTSNASAQDALGGNLGKLELDSTFGLTVDVRGGQLVIEQHLVFHLDFKHLATEASGNIVDRWIVDTYSVGVDENGKLVVALVNSAATDNSQQPSVDGFQNFWTNVNDYTSAVAQWAQGLTAGHLKDVPVSFADNFVFPGATTFTFADATFSQTGDLVSHITYVSNL